MQLAASLFNSGRLAESKDVLQRILQLQPDNGTALNDLAFVLLQTGGDINEAEKLVRRALQTDLNNVHAKDTLGWIYLKQNNPDAAVQVFDGLVKTNAKDPSFHYHLGAALLKKGDRERGRAQLDAALNAKPLPGEEKEIRALLAASN
jgi:Flp pilus assembly protein TadD